MNPIASALRLAASTAQATASLYRLCEGWSDAPRAAHELMDDLERATMFSNLVKDGLKSRDRRGGEARGESLEEIQTTTKELVHLLRKAEAVVTKIQAFLDKLLVQQDNSVNAGLNSNRRLRWLEHSQITNRLRKVLKEIMARMCALLILRDFIVSEEARAALGEVSEKLTYEGIPVAKALEGFTCSNVDAPDGQIPAETTTHTTCMSEQLQDHQAQTEKFLGAPAVLNEAHLAGDFDVKYLQAEFSEKRRQMEKRNPRFRPHLQPGPEVLGQRSPGAGDSGAPFYGSWDTSSPRADSVHARSLSVSRCPSDCRCVCHATRDYGSWSISWLNRALGSVSVSYQGPLLWKTACTDFKCLASRTKAPRWVRASYTLPPWLLQMTLSMLVSPGPPTPELLLRVINRLPNVSSPEAFWNLKGIVERGDVEALKFSIANRLASVHDVHHPTGQTALLFAIRFEKFDMVKILLHAGADPFQGSVSTAAATALLNRIHIGSPGIQRIAALFSVTDIMEAYGYTDLHKIILGIHPIDACEAIARNPVIASQVNQPTAAGLTPAHLAAIRGSTAQLAALRQAGADLSRRSANDSTALHAACTSQKASAARFLLDAGPAAAAAAAAAAARQANASGMTPLHCLASSSAAAALAPDARAVGDRLLALGADVDARARGGATPLMYAANADAPGAAAYLLARGAAVDARDADGDTALAEAIYSRSPGCVRVLLAAGADVAGANAYGRGALHYLAGAGSEDIVDLFRATGALARAGAGGLVDKRAVDKDGLDAMALLDRRPNVSPGLRDKFRRLLDSIPDRYVQVAPDVEDRKTWKHHRSASDSSEDEYFDAEQYQKR